MAYETLGADKIAALLGFHAFTGCDQTSKSCGQSKLTCWKIFTAANENIIYAFKRLGDNEDDTMDSICKELVQFVVKLYFKPLPKKYLTLAETRWHLYSKYQDSDRLLPTAAALKYKIPTTRLMRLIWKSSHLRNPTSPDPENERQWIYASYDRSVTSTRCSYWDEPL